MRALLVRFGLWIARWGGWPSTLVLARTAQLCTQWDGHEASGEYKRHQVYAQLIKDFPRVSKRTIGLAIELALMV